MTAHNEEMSTLLNEIDNPIVNTTIKSSKYSLLSLTKGLIIDCIFIN